MPLAQILGVREGGDVHVNCQVKDFRDRT